MTIKRLIIIFSISTILLFVNFMSASAQNTDTTKVKEDILKEFRTDSFKDAAPITVKDSSFLKKHLIGIKWGYSISNVGLSQDLDHKSFTTPVNFGVYYTYLHSLWGNMPYFGFQTGLEYYQQGYVKLSGEKGSQVEDKELYTSVAIPMLAQFRVDFWKMRLMVNAGPFVSYKISTNQTDGIPATTKKIEYGIMGGGGFGFVLCPIEIHLECNYKYSLSNLYTPQIYSDQVWIYTHSNQLVFSLGIYYSFGGIKKK